MASQDVDYNEPRPPITLPGAQSMCNLLQTIHRDRKTY